MAQLFPDITGTVKFGKPPANSEGLPGENYRYLTKMPTLAKSSNTIYYGIFLFHILKTTAFTNITNFGIIGKRH